MGESAVANFRLTEPGGVNWPNQPIEFRYDGGRPNPQTTRMIGPDGVTEIPYQWVSSCAAPAATKGCIAIRDSLSANANQTYTLQSGAAPVANATNPVLIQTVPCFGMMCWQITNGRTGLRIPQSQASPFNAAPIEGILLADGATWTGVGGSANLLYSGPGCAMAGTLHTPMPCAASYRARLIDAGPLKTVVEVDYTFHRPNFTYGAINAASVDSDANAIRLNGSYDYDGERVGFSRNGNTLPGGLAENTVYIAHRVPGATNTYTYTLASTGAAVDLTSSGSGNWITMGYINVAGTGHYTAKFTLYSNSKSILLDEDSDMVFSYYLPFYSQVQPDTARWRGHDAWDGSKNSPYCGYNTPVAVKRATNTSPIVLSFSSPVFMGTPTGLAGVAISGVNGNTAANTSPGGVYYLKGIGPAPYISASLYRDAALTVPVAGNGEWTGGGIVKVAYTGQTIDPVQDAFFDISYASDMPASYICTPGVSNRKMVINYPSADHAAGWSFLTYQSGGSAASPVLGWYVGDYGTFWWTAMGPSTPGLYSSNSDWITHSPNAMIQVDNLIRAPDGSVVHAGNNYSVHRNWGIFVSTKADVLAADQHQPISDDQNTLTGINLTRLESYQLSFPDPPGGWKWLYNPPSAMNTLIALVRDGTSYCGSPGCYRTLLNNSGGSDTATITAMWAGNSTAAVQAALNKASGPFEAVVKEMANGENHWNSTYGGYQLGLNWGFKYTPLLNAILMDSNSTSAQKAAAKKQLALYGSLLWDNDYRPLADDGTSPSGASCGLANQCLQFVQYRANIAMAIPTHPVMAAKQTIALSWTKLAFAEAFNIYGSPQGSTHYQGTYTEPLYANFRLASLIPNGSGGHLTSFDSPTWSRYAKWELSIQTPPEPRFGNIRKAYSNGDGNTEADARTGLLATALNDINPELASKLSGAWWKSNTASYLTQDDQFLPTFLEIDPTIPQASPNTGSFHFPGYHSAMRYGYGTANETALWFINGGFYQLGGHRHADDGQVSIYALAAPLAIDWNANLYSPHISGELMHDRVVFDTELGAASWAADNPSLETPGNLYEDHTQKQFSAFPGSTKSCTSFSMRSASTVWTRCVLLAAVDPSYPLIYVRDTFTGAAAAAPKTLTWNLMAAGPVNTPAGTIAPVLRFSEGCQAPAGQLPSNSPLNPLGAGIQAFHFTGAVWPRHATRGIDWDLWTINPSRSAQFLIGNWGHGCQSTREAGEFQKANGAPFNERQDILRVHDTGSFTTIIAPYRKTEAPRRSVTEQPCGIQIVQERETTCFSDAGMTYSNGTRHALSVYDSSRQSAYGFTASGGAQELIDDGAGTLTWTIDDVVAGTREIILPDGAWFPAIPVPYSNGSYRYYHEGGAQPFPVTIQFMRTPAPLRAVSFDFKAPAGAVSMGIRYGSASYATIAKCSGTPLTCSATFQSPPGVWNEQHDFLDSHGNVIASSESKEVR